MKLVYDHRCLDYSQPGHPESPERVKSTIELLADKYEIVSPDSIQESDIIRIHSENHLMKLKSNQFFDPDTPAFDNIYEIAELSAAAAVTSAKYALKGQQSLSLMSHPGHHSARDSIAGFCYLNNIAIASAYLLESVDKVAILDFDCHHGNGTQDIFLRNNQVLYVSLHESPQYPGTGLKSEDNCRNYPVPPGTDESQYLPLFEKALGEISDFSPDVLAISAGFDTFREDPITGLYLEVSTFRQIGYLISSLKIPSFSILEGGYATRLNECVMNYIQGITDY